MLVATIEIWPGGHEEGKYKLGEITASDISDGNDSAYLVRVQFDGYEPEGLAAVNEEILLWDHDSSVGAMSLIRQALAVGLLLPDPTSRESEAGPDQPRRTRETMGKASGSSRSEPAAKAAPTLFAPENRRRLSGSGLRTFVAIANLWGLTEEQRRLILGYPARSTYRGWIKTACEYRSITLSVDVLIRISAMLGIYAGLKILFADEEEGFVWLHQTHDDRAFGGAAPIDLITSGFQDALLTVRRFFEAARGGLYMSPSSDERDWPPYDDSEIKFVDREE
ncbi:hypothetical protein [Sphingopyxis sp.]|uniref:hypothetical protein n=1 Tax=Sphingopyxis sp. TaxID=1908224 RepID=UPI002D77FB71|nr:hypothetical protein [Sphingopyxis sp.]HET6526120.1 hypothetical protein [Sphingopyxis sp.]